MATPDISPRRESATPPAESTATPEAELRSLTETRKAHATRKAHRAGLYVLAFVALAVLIYLVALVAMNTSRVSVSWVFGTSSVSLVWLVLFAAVLGWLLGLLMSILFRWRTRRARNVQSRPHGESSTQDTSRR
jgi:uncharacterized integral membrane protein